MSSANNFSFYNLDRIEDDKTCESQRTAQNTRYSSYTTSNFFSELPSDSHVQFATSQPAIVPDGNSGSGVGGNNVESESSLLLKTEQERHLGKLSLMSRPYATVPFLGRGSVDPALESQLLEGEQAKDKKSVSTVMSKSFMGYTMYPTDSNMEDRVHNTKYTVEESASNTWIRGGADTRGMAQDTGLAQNNRSTNKSF
jgi:hypothetical protein